MADNNLLQSEKGRILVSEINKLIQRMNSFDSAFKSHFGIVADTGPPLKELQLPPLLLSIEEIPRQHLSKPESKILDTPSIQPVDDLGASSIQCVSDLLDFGALCPVLNMQPTLPPPKALPENPTEEPTDERYAEALLVTPSAKPPDVSRAFDQPPSVDVDDVVPSCHTTVHPTRTASEKPQTKPNDVCSTVHCRKQCLPPPPAVYGSGRPETKPKRAVSSHHDTPSIAILQISFRLLKQKPSKPQQQVLIIQPTVLPKPPHGIYFPPTSPIQHLPTLLPSQPSDLQHFSKIKSRSLIARVHHKHFALAHWMQRPSAKPPDHIKHACFPTFHTSIYSKFHAPLASLHYTCYSIANGVEQFLLSTITYLETINTVHFCCTLFQFQTSTRGPHMLVQHRRCKEWINHPMLCDT